MSGNKDNGSGLDECPRIPRDEIHFSRDDMLGQGNFGTVYLAKCKIDGKVTSVAVKQVFDKQKLEELRKEAFILSKIKHPNIIKFYGVSEPHSGSCCDFLVVTEYAAGGSLFDFLHNSQMPDPAFKQIISWALQTANGLNYLHNEAPVRTIHRDLKSQNILLTEELVCMLCDFGVSKNPTHSATVSSFRGTIPWMSPEIIKGELISSATDIWSYGVVLWEMLTRKVPYEGLTEFGVYSLVASKGSTLVRPENCPEAYARLMEKCWKMDQKERCDIREVIDTLVALLKEIN